jgi:hypothetical protein
MSDYFINGKHIDQRESEFCGTPFTASIRALEGHAQSRRDDLESLGYNFMFIINPDLIPWTKDSTQGDVND